MVRFRPWLPATARSIAWSPLVLVVVLGVAALSLTRILDEAPPVAFVGVAVAAVVVVALTGLHDQARDLVHAVPTSAARRLLHRCVLIAPAAAVGVVALEGTVSWLYGHDVPVPGGADLVALAACGVAGVAAFTRRFGCRATMPVAGVLGAWVASGPLLVHAGLPEVVAAPWATWSAAVTSGALAVTVSASSRGVAA